MGRVGRNPVTVFRRLEMADVVGNYLAVPFGPESTLTLEVVLAQVGHFSRFIRGLQRLFFRFTGGL